MKTLLYVAPVVFILGLFSCSKEPTIRYQQTGNLDLTFAEGSFTSTSSITAQWKNTALASFVSLQYLDLYAGADCNGTLVSSTAVSGYEYEKSFNLLANGTYSYRIRTSLRSQRSTVSECSAEISVLMPPTTPLFPLSVATGTGDFQFAAGYSPSMAVDSNGKYLFADNGRIQILDAYTGLYVSSFGMGSVGDVQNIEIDVNGNIFAIGYGGEVTKFDEDYNLLASASVGSNVGLSLDNLGNVYVTSYTGQFVRKLDNNLNDLGAFVTGLNYAGDSVWDASGNMWLANSYSSQLIKYDSSGNVLQSITAPLWFPRSVRILQNGNLAVSDASYITYEIDPNSGLVISQFNMPGSNPSAPWSSSQIFNIMPDGDMLIFYHNAGTYYLGKFGLDGTPKSY